MRSFLCIALIAMLALFTHNSYSQPLACPLVTSNVNAGPDQTICKGTCTQLSASLFTVNVPATDTYRVDSFAYNPYPFDSGASYTSLTQDDYYGGAIDLPFPFCFYGNRYTKCMIGANGEVGFNLGEANQPITWSISGAAPDSVSGMVNAILSPYQDLYLPDGGHIYYATYGTAPCRTFVVSWDSVAYFTAAGCPGRFGVQQVVLHESTNQIDINIKQKPFCTGWNSGKAILGLEDATGKRAITAPGKNATVYALTNTTYSFIPAGTQPGSTLYTWYTDTGVVGRGRIITVCPDTTTTYVLQAMIYAACDTIFSYDTLTVYVTPPPPKLVAGNNGPLCLKDTLQLTATAISGAKYTWRGPNNFKSNLQNPFINGVIAADSGMYIVTDTMEGCYPQMDSTNVLVDNVVAKIITDKNAVCAKGTLKVSFGGIAPDTNTHYTWSFSNGTLLSGNPQDTGEGPFVLRYDTVGNKIITLKVQNWRCIANISDTIPVNWAPQLSFNMPKDICIDDTVKVVIPDNSLAGIDSVLWNFDGADNISDIHSLLGSYYVSYTSSGQKVISLQIRYKQCLSDPYLDTVTVHNLPNAKIVGINKDAICAGDSILATANTGNGFTYLWAPVKWFLPYNPDTNVAWAEIPESGYIYLSLRDQYKCLNMDSMYINTQPCCVVSLPSAFTPNGDGRNDIFRPITVGHHKIKKFVIVNRYGQVVFESNNERDGWDGNLFGVPQNIDTYFYYIKYECNGKDIEEKGDVTLIR